MQVGSWEAVEEGWAMDGCRCGCGMDSELKPPFSLPP